MKKLLQIHAEDNVAVALVHLRNGDEANGTILKDDIPRGHKVALKEIEPGKLVVKYGMPIGTATSRIRAGEHVHVHNMKSRLSYPETYEYAPCKEIPLCEPKDLNRTFRGFRRGNGSVGLRNDLWIVPTVGCVNRLARRLAQVVQRKLPTGSVKRCFALEHPLGCSQVGEDHLRTARILAALASHPNAGGVLILSLGCENNTLESFRELLDSKNERFRFLKAQDEGNEFETGLAMLDGLLAEASQDRREDVSLSELKIGLKCGGSDALSGITANPLLGSFSDRIIAAGGTTVLTEVPEMFGAEMTILGRCLDADVFARGVQMINDFKEYFLRHGERIDENPSPGNKEGGISTLEDKSIGCIQKGGSAPVMDVLQFGRSIGKNGLNLLDGPGNDMIACTVLAAAGCQMILFTTGRGTPFGSVVPTMKISSNSELAVAKPHWIDFDAGRLLHDVVMPDLTDQLMKKVLDTASGDEETSNERNGYQEIALFKDGVTL